MDMDVEMGGQAEPQFRDVFYAANQEEAMQCLNEKRTEKLDLIAQGQLTFGSQHL